MRRGLAAGLALTLLGLCAPAAAPAQPGASATAPAPPGSPQRRAILNALRPAVEARLGPNVEFVVTAINVRQGHAFVIAEPQRRGGRRIDGYAIFGRDFETMDGLTTTAILRFQYGRWNLVEHAIGATDVWYCDIARYGVARGFGC
jgi:hypothetical protein